MSTLVCVSGLALLTPGATSAQGPQPIATEALPQPQAAGMDLGARVQPATRWYGWQTLSADGTSLLIATGAAFAAPDSGARRGLAFAGLGTYLLGAPITHAAHGRWGAAFGSLGLRALPFGLGLLTARCALAEPLFSRGGGGNCNVLGALTVLGVVLPIVVDPVLLAREPAPVRSEPRVQIDPWVSSYSAGINLAREF